MAEQTIVVYFGCWGQAGHFLWASDGRMMDRYESDRLHIPSPGQLDGTNLFLPRPEKIGHGAITYLPAPNLTVLAWWGGSPWDDRGAVNSAIITNGDLGITEIWGRFARHFSELSAQLAVPMIAD